MKISKSIARTIAAAMKNTTLASKRKAVVERFMVELNCSSRTVYAAAKKGGWQSGRKKRADKGHSKMAKNDIIQITELIAASKRKDRLCIMDSATALQVASDSGMVTVGPSQFNRLRRTLRLSSRDLEHDRDLGPHVNLRSLHPNHCHQFDITPCVQYFFDDKGLRHRDMKTEFYLGKPENIAKIKRKLLRFVLIDHWSGAFAVKYFYATGERAIDVCSFLIESWSAGAGGSPKSSFHGLPSILMCDQGSAAMAEMTTGLLDALDVERLVHMPGNPRTKGSVEGFMKIWEMKFESRLSIQAAPDLETLNEWAVDFATRYQVEESLGRSARKLSRQQLWSTIRPEQLRLPPPPEVCRELLHTRAETRSVKGNLTITYKGALYRIPNSDLEGKKVEVTINPYRWKVAAGERRSVDVLYVDPAGDHHKYEAREVLRDAAGFLTGPGTAVIGESFSRHKYTETERFLAEMDQKEEGVGDGLQVFGHHAEKVEGVAFLPKRGFEVEVESRVAPEISLSEALLEVKAKLGRSLSEEEAAVIEAMGSWTRDAIAKLVERFEREEIGGVRGESFPPEREA